MPGLVAAYRHYGATLTNERWSWSALAENGDVVLTLWKDELNYRTRPVSYDLFDHPRLAEWTNRPGNRERIQHLRRARDHTGGRFRVVIATAVDQNATTRQTSEAYARPNIIMRLIDLNEQTGEFRAIMEGTDATGT